jgi:FlaA1/EpsC-like NDP-sugar epimerase
MNSPTLNHFIADVSVRSDIPWDLLEGRTVMVSGATGLVGRMIVLTLLKRNEVAATPIRVVSLVRNLEKANALLLEVEYHSRAIRDTIWPRDFNYCSADFSGWR